MAKFEIRLKNAKVTMAYFNKLPGEIKKAISIANGKAGLLVERYSKQKAPFDTGLLRNTIIPTNYGAYAIIGSYTSYARYVHEGTRFMTARPYMREAIDQAIPQINEYYSQEISKRL